MALTSDPSPSPEVEALRECIDTLALCEREAFVDSEHAEAVRALGERIGYGAMMATASALWAAEIRASGMPAGSQYVAGPCHSTVVRALQIARTALAQLGAETGEGER